jgi:tRNA (cmo5U34)-methyltransferase
VTANEWKTSERVDHYLELVDTVPHLAEGESVLLEQLPSGACRILDLGTGDGRLLARVRADRPASAAVAVDVSEPMLERAHERFADQPVELLHHDLAEPLPDLGRFDSVVILARHPPPRGRAEAIAL